MATLLLEGFDVYGPPVDIGASSGQANLSGLLSQGGWSYISVGDTEPQIVLGLNGLSGYALKMCPTAGPSGQIIKTLGQNYSRLIGGVRISANILTSVGVVFYDGSVAQVSVLAQEATGNIIVTSGANGTILQTSPLTLGSGEEHYLEWDISFNPTLGGWAVWLDGMLAAQGTGNTAPSGNSQANALGLGTFADPTTFKAGYIVFDDLYLFDDTSSYNNCPLLCSPVVLTQVPVQDLQVNLISQGSLIGNYYPQAILGSPYGIGGNYLYLLPVSALANTTVETLVLGLSSSLASNPSARYEGVVYSDLSGKPHNLLSGGTPATGFVSGAQVTLGLSTPVSLTGGTQYWIGLINDSSMSFEAWKPDIALGAVAANTYTSGPPSSAPSMSYGQTSVVLFGECVSTAHNYPSVGLNPPQGDISSVASALNGAADLYNFSVPSLGISEIFSVAVSANARMQSGATLELALLASAANTVSQGSAGEIVPTTGYLWYDSIFDLNPATGAPWGTNDIASAFFGMQVFV